MKRPLTMYDNAGLKAKVKEEKRKMEGTEEGNIRTRNQDNLNNKAKQQQQTHHKEINRRTLITNNKP